MKKFRQKKPEVNLFLFEYLHNDKYHELKFEAHDYDEAIEIIKSYKIKKIIPDLDSPGELKIISFDIYPNSYYGFFYNLKSFIKDIDIWNLFPSKK